MTDTDLSTWVLTRDAAMRIGCSTRTIERLAADGKLEKRLRPQKGSPDVAVFSPESVAEEAARRRPAPPPFVLDTGRAVAHGNGQHTSDLSNTHTRDVLARLPAGDDPIRLLFAAALRAVLSPPSPPVSGTVAETVYVTVKEAARILGLPQADVRRLIHDGDLNCRRTGRGGIRIRRTDLEQC